MADNYDFTPGSGATAAADEIASVKYPRVKLIEGADGVNDGDISAANPLPVQQTDGTTPQAVAVEDSAAKTNGPQMMVKAHSSLPTAVTSADAINILADLYGRLRVILETPAGDSLINDTADSVKISQATASNLNAQVVGDVANDSADSGNPVKFGGLAKTANPTAVADGDRVNALFDKTGKQVIVGSIRDLKGVQKTTITSSTSETTIITAVASTYLDLYGLIIANTSATACNVTIKDSTAGTTRAIIAVPAGETRGFMLPESASIVQASTNNNWTATCSASVASIEITALFVKNI